MDIDGAIDEFLGERQNSLTSKTMRWYTQRLALFSSWCKENKIEDTKQLTAARAQDFIASIPSDNSYTVHGYAQVLKSFLKWCASDKETGVPASVVEKFRMPKREESPIEILSDEDIRKLFRASEKMPYPYRAKAIVHILLDTGIRASELCYDSSRPEEETGLRMENLFLGRAGEESYIRVMGKGRKSRTIGLGSSTIQAMRKYLNRERGRDESEYVFLSRRGPLGVRMLEQFITDLGDLAGVPNCYPHRFRHTFAVNQLMAGTSELVLMRLMGHTSLEATKIYVRGMAEVQARKSAPSVVDRLKKRQ